MMRDPLTPEMRAKVDAAAKWVVGFVKSDRPLPRQASTWARGSKSRALRPLTARAIEVRDRLKAGEQGATIARSLGISRPAVYQMRDRLKRRGEL